MEIQQSIKNNAEDLQTFIREMNLWEKEMKRKEKLLLESPESEQNQNLPPIRNKISKMENGTTTDENSLDKQKREQSLFEKERGNEFVKQNKWTEAIFHYTEAISSYSWDATFYTNRALCFLKLKKWKEAETDCTTALQIDSTYDKAYFRRALALKELNQFKEARNDLLEMLRLNPENNTVQNELAKLEKLIPEDKRNEMASISALMKPELPQDKKQLAYVKKDMGNAFVKSKEWKLAIECYTEACSLYPEDASFYLNRALCFLKTNEPQKTILDCCRVLELDADNVKAYYRRALAHQKSNNLSKAHEDLLAAFKLDPSNEDVGKTLNAIEVRLGMRPEKTEKDEVYELQVEHVDQKSDCESSESKRITGKRFIKSGGRFLKLERKPAHMLCKKPLRKVKIVDKNEKTGSILESALDELNSISADHSIGVKEDCGKCEVNAIMKNSLKSNSDQVDELQIPKTAIQFMSSWDKLNNEYSRQFIFLKKIGGNNFPSVFKDALESSIFSEMLDVLAEYCIQHNEPVFEFLDGLSKVKRFSALLLFATADDTKNIERLLEHCEKADNTSKEALNELRLRYYCR